VYVNPPPDGAVVFDVLAFAPNVITTSRSPAATVTLIVFGVVELLNAVAPEDAIVGTGCPLSELDGCR
jgi:hypothetical protein